MFTPTDTVRVSIGEAARLLGVSTVTLRRWDAAGKLTPLPRHDKQRREYDLVAVQSYAEQQVAA